MGIKLTYVVVDDDILAHKTLDNHISKYEFLEFVGSCQDAFSAVSLLIEKKPDLLFLDIEMPGMSGMELLEIIDKSIKVIITSSFPNYAIDALLFNVVGYLKKPIRPEVLCKTLSKVMLLYSLNKTAFEQQKNNYSISYIYVKCSGKEEKLYISDILMCKVNGNSVNIVRDDNRHFKYDASLKKMIEILPSGDFVRINKSIIISINKIKFRKGNEIELIDNNPYKIGEEYIEQFEILFNK